MTYKHLKNLLVRRIHYHALLRANRPKKPLPLNTPVTLELEPRNHIQVTLFDANHCPGAVMFCQWTLFACVAAIATC